MIDFDVQNCIHNDDVAINECTNYHEIPRTFSSFYAIYINAGTGGLGASGRIELLRDFLGDRGIGFDAVMVSETLFLAGDAACYGVDDFSLLSVERDNGSRGGGLGCFVRSNCTVQSFVGVSSPDGNIQAITIHIKKMSFEGFVIGTYSSNAVHRSSLLDVLEELLPTGSSLPCIFMGDTNIDLLSESVSREYCDFLKAHGFKSVVTGVTRPASGTCLDHIALRNCTDFIQISPGIWQTPLFSDHYPVFTILKGNRKCGGTSKRTDAGRLARRHDDRALADFERHIGRANWSPIYDLEDVDDAFDCFREEISRIYDKSCPLIQREHHGRETDFRFSPGLRSRRASVGKLYRWYKKIKSVESKSRYYIALRGFRCCVILRQEEVLY